MREWRRRVEKSVIAGEILQRGIQPDSAAELWIKFLFSPLFFCLEEQDLSFYILRAAQGLIDPLATVGFPCMRAT